MGESSKFCSVDDSFDPNEHIASSRVNKELEKFREYFNPENKIVSSGKHFDEEAFKQALEIYRQNYAAWNWKQLNLFCVCVIGYFERILPACDLLKIREGLALTDKNKVANNDSPPCLGELGFDYFFWLTTGGAVTKMANFQSSVDTTWVNRYFQKKKQSLETLATGLNFTPTLLENWFTQGNGSK